GPNSFAVDDANGVHTDIVWSATDSTISFRTNGGDALFGMGKTGTPVNYITTIATGTGVSPIIEAASSVDANAYLELRGGGTSGTTSGVLIGSGVAQRIAAFIGVASALSSFSFTSAASGTNVLLDVGGTATGLSIGGTTATGVILGKSGGTLGAYGSAGATKPTVTGSRGANAALASLMTALSSIGLVTDSTS